jgi:hypothetical protein
MQDRSAFEKEKIIISWHLISLQVSIAKREKFIFPQQDVVTNAMVIVNHLNNYRTCKYKNTPANSTMQVFGRSTWPYIYMRP